MQQISKERKQLLSLIRVAEEQKKRLSPEDYAVLSVFVARDNEKL